MFTIPKNTGSVESRVKTDYGTLYFTKFDDGRFEYYGLLTIPTKTSFVNIKYPVKPIDVIGVATNYYANINTALVSMSCSVDNARLDIVMQDGSTPTYHTAVNILIKGKWK